MMKSKLSFKIVCVLCCLFTSSFLTRVSAQERDLLVSVEFPNNGEGDIGGYVSGSTGYKLTYFAMRALPSEVHNGNLYYQFHSGPGSYVKIESPENEYFQPGDSIVIDTYVTRSAADSREIEIYNSVDYNNGVCVAIKSIPGSVVTMCSIVLDNNLPANTNVLFLPATSNINDYINIHSVAVYGDRGAKAKLASLTVGGIANLKGFQINYSVLGASTETTASLSYEKETGKDVTLAISDVQPAKVSDPGTLTNWNSSIPASLPIPSTPGSANYYYLRSSLAEHGTVYYEIEILRRNTVDVTYNYNLTVNPITSEEDLTLSNIANNTGTFVSGQGWRFNNTSSPDETIQLKVDGDAIIQLRGHANNGATTKITASVDNAAAGNIITPDYGVTAAKSGLDNTFYYAGESNVITFTYSGASGYLTHISIYREGATEADLRAVFVGETELALSDFTDGKYTFPNKGYIENPSASGIFSGISLAMKKGQTAPTVTSGLNTIEHFYSHSFEYKGTTYQVIMPYEAEIGYTVNDVEKRYDVTTKFGLSTVVDLINKGTATYKTVYIKNGTYDFGDTGPVDSNYMYGLTISASGVTLTGESHEARIIGRYYGVTSSIIRVTGNNNILRNFTIETPEKPNDGQMPSLGTSGLNNLFDKMRIIGKQDTYTGGGSNLFHECLIVGGVDFICNGYPDPATGQFPNHFDYFLRCELQFKGGSAFSAPQGRIYFRDCTVSAFPGSTVGNFAMSRPWRSWGKAYFINTTFNIVPTNAFVGMSENIFPEGSAGTVGNIKASDRTLLSFTNDAGTPTYTMTDTDIATYSSIYTICGATLAALVKEPVTIPAGGYTTLCAADALIAPEGVTVYAVESVNENFAVLEEYPGGAIPAGTPVVLEAEVSEETVFQFVIIENSFTEELIPNLLAGSLVHKQMSDNTVNYYVLDNEAFAKQNASPRIDANTAYLALDSDVETLPLSATNSIRDVYMDAAGDGRIYDLQGRLVSNPQKGQIYIVNGKKVLYLK